MKELKIDRSFVTNLPNEESNGIIVRSSIAMAHSLGLTVVAEGAEDAMTCALLADAGCDLIQGYYLAKPMEPDELRDWILAGASRSSNPFVVRRQLKRKSWRRRRATGASCQFPRATSRRRSGAAASTVRKALDHRPGPRMDPPPE